MPESVLAGTNGALPFWAWSISGRFVTIDIPHQRIYFIRELRVVKRVKTVVIFFSGGDGGVGGGELGQVVVTSLFIMAYVLNGLIFGVVGVVRSFG